MGMFFLPYGGLHVLVCDWCLENPNIKHTDLREERMWIDCHRMHFLRQLGR